MITNGQSHNAIRKSRPEKIDPDKFKRRAEYHFKQQISQAFIF